jgi:hypothetical protein
MAMQPCCLFWYLPLLIEQCPNIHAGLLSGTSVDGNQCPIKLPMLHFSVLSGATSAALIILQGRDTEEDHSIRPSQRGLKSLARSAMQFCQPMAAISSLKTSRLPIWHFINMPAF